MSDTRIYTGMSPKALEGLQRLTEGRDIYFSPVPTERGFTVLTKPSADTFRRTWSPIKGFAIEP